MNKKLFIVLMSFGFLLSVSPFAMGYGDYEGDLDLDEEDYSLSSCGSDIFSDTSIIKLIEHYNGGKCLEKWTLNDKCNCIYKKIHGKYGKNKDKHGKKEDEIHTPEEGEDVSHLNERVEKSFDNTLEKIEESKKEYWKQFTRSYEKVTVQASAQAEILQLQNGSEDQGFVGCTPRLFTAGVKDKLDPTIQKQIDLLNSDKAKLEQLLQKCESKKDNLNIFGLRERQCLTAKQSYAMIEKNIERLQKLKSHESKQDCSLVLGALKSGDIQERVDEILANEKFQKIVPKVFKSLPLGELLKDVQDGKIDVSKYGVNDCSALISRFNQLENIYTKFVKKEMKSGKGEEVLVDPADYVSSQCGNINDPLCAQMASINEDLIGKMEELHTSKDSDCITYAEYTAYQGRPSEDFLKEISRSKNPDKMLDSHEGTVFLKSNPLIGMVANGSDRKELASSLKKMAKNVLEQKSDAGKFGAYLDFVKGDFADLYKKQGKSSAMHVCNELASIYTAITISNDDSKVVKEDDQYSDNSFIKLEQVLNRCSAKVQKKIKTSGLEESLQPFKTFLMGSESKPNEEPTPEGFETLKATVCKGFDEHRTQNCQGDVSASACRGSFKSAFSPYKEKMKENGVKEELDTKSFERISATMDETKQDHEFVKYWEENVGSKLDNNVLAGPNDRGEFAASMARNKAIMSSPDIMTNYNMSRGISPDLASGDDTQPGPAGENFGVSQNGDQGRNEQVPDWAQEEKFVDPNINPKSVKAPQDLVPGFQDLIPEQKVKALQEVKDLVGGRSDLPFNSDVVDDEIDKYEQKIVQDENGNDKKDEKSLKAKEDKDDKVKYAGAATAGSNSGGFRPSNVTNSVSNGNSFSAGIGSSSVSGGGKISKLEKQSKAYNDAKLDMYDENGSSSSRGPASIDDVVVNIQKGTASMSDSDSKLPQLIVQVEPKETPNFGHIWGKKEDFEEYITKTIKGLDKEKYGDKFDLVLVDPSAVANPDDSKTPPLMKVRIVRDASGAYNASFMPYDRKATLLMLERELKK